VGALDIRIAGTVTPERGDGARKANVSQSTVHEYVERFRKAGLSWPLPAEMSESDLERKLYPDDPGVLRPG
jgi:hypothetical protein